ncbi:YdcF family protein [Bosea sp. ASV33]|uniref:YdcF family protein n=1 Tax=Bosea sp. ASV33 TaxID=2795106 RepID=UPI0020C147BE|nr:YdcF family protein [Bosea sp. ASV33]
MAMIGSTNDHLAMAQSDSAPRSGKPARSTSLRRILGLAAAATAGLGVLLFGIGYVRFAAMIDGRERTDTPRTDAIVVVTGGAQRVGDAISLLGAERGQRLLISGVNEKTGREELAKLNPASRELLSCCVDLDYRARNTIGNAIETRRWVRRHGFRSLLVVTSNYHMPRTLAEFGHAMPGVQLVAHPVVTDHIDASGWWNRWPVVKVLVPEYAKYLVARLRSLVETDPETSRLSVIIGGRKPVSPKPADTLGPAAEKRTRLMGQHRHEG